MVEPIIIQWIKGTVGVSLLFLAPTLCPLRGNNVLLFLKIQLAQTSDSLNITNTGPMAIEVARIVFRLIHFIM